MIKAFFKGLKVIGFKCLFIILGFSLVFLLGHSYLYITSDNYSFTHINTDDIENIIFIGLFLGLAGIFLISMIIFCFFYILEAGGYEFKD